MVKKTKEPFPIVTINEIPGYTIEEAKGLVWKNSVRSKFILEDIKAIFRVLLGGEVHEYRQLINEGRREVIEGLIANARSLGANAVVGYHMFSSQIIGGTIEISGFGTAVVIKKSRKK